jgi:DNA-binding response OmpR family regulator
VYRLIKVGRIPAVRVGRQWRFHKRDIDAWLASNRGLDVDRPRILVVDDEASVRDMIAQSLSTRDYDVDSVEDGPTAVERLKAQNYDLLITDLKMPGMDGLSVIRAARQQSAELPIIIITGFSTEASAIEAINLGVCGYLTKPFRMPRVIQIAARALGEPPPDVDA